jgi:hypothetical protein
VLRNECAASITWTPCSPRAFSAVTFSLLKAFGVDNSNAVAELPADSGDDAVGEEVAGQMRRDH